MVLNSDAREQSASAPLPLLVTADDVREIVRYLKKKPHGTTLAEIRTALKKQVSYPRKIATYEMWNLIERDGDLVKLSLLGLDLAQKLAHESAVFRIILNNIKPYRAALEWIHQHNLDIVTNTAVAAFWREHHADAVVWDDESAVRETAVCFFHLCWAASLGTLTNGTKGQPTRLYIDREELAGYIENEPLAFSWTGPATVLTAGQVSNGASDKLRVFLPLGKSARIVEQVQTMLALAGFEYETIEKEDHPNVPVAARVFSAMRRCSAAIIPVVLAENGSGGVNAQPAYENILAEIGAAFAFFGHQLILLWDKRIPVPSNLTGLHRCEVEDGVLTWDAGVQLMTLIQSFKK